MELGTALSLEAAPNPREVVPALELEDVGEEVVGEVGGDWKGGVW